MKPFQPFQISLSSPKLIEASAGTGKTYAITGLVLRLLLEEGLELSQILIVTFTEAATAELKGRVRERLAKAYHAVERQPSKLNVGEDHEATLNETQAIKANLSTLEPELAANLSEESLALAPRRLELALREFDEAAIHTIHGFCRKALTENAFESGEPFEFDLLHDEETLLLQLSQDYYVNATYEIDPKLIGPLRKKGFTPKELWRLGRERAKDPKARIHPAIDPTLPEPDLTPLSEAFAQLKRLWPRGKAAFARLLQSSVGLNGSKYKLENLPKYEAALEAFLRSGSITAGVPKELIKYNHEYFQHGFKKGHQPPAEPADPFMLAVADYMEIEERLTAEIDRFCLSRLTHFLEWLPLEYQKRKLKEGLFSYDDLIEKLKQALDEDQSTRGTGALTKRLQSLYKAALIDEFQDTDPSQYRIFSSLFGAPDSRLFLIGDPKQAIYAFRGADIFAYLEAAQAAGEERYGMETNWRSDPGLLDGLNHLFAMSPRPFLFDQIGYIPVSARPEANNALASPAIEMHFLERGDQPPFQDPKKPIEKNWAKEAFAKLAVNQIVQLLEDPPLLETEKGPQRLRPKDIAVLTRTNAQAERLAELLNSLGVPAVCQSRQSVFESDEAWELWQFLLALLEPGNLRRVKAALSLPLLGVSEAELLRFEEDPNLLDHWMGRFRHWHQLWSKEGLQALYPDLYQSERVAARILALPRGERKLTNYNHLFELLLQRQAEDRASAQELLGWMGNQMQDASTLEEQEIRLESDKEAVQLLTIHKSKGLEFPLVFLPYLYESAERDVRNLKYFGFHDPKEGAKAFAFKTDDTKELLELHQREEMAEALRLLYVALTRAKHKLFLFFGPVAGAHKSAFSFLNARPLGFAGGFEELGDLYAALVSTKAPFPDYLTAFQLWDQSKIRIHAHREIPPLRPIRLDEERPDPEELKARIMERSIEWGYRVSSYSGLILGAEHAQAPTPAQEERPDAPEPDLHHLDREIPLADFPKGAHAGNFFHEVLERLDFCDPKMLSELIQTLLEKHHLPLDWQERIETYFLDLLRCPLPGGFPLAEIPAEDRLAEMDFLMQAGRKDLDLSAYKLAEVFRRHSGPWPATYPDQLEKLAFRPLFGYLKGFIDLTFRREGKYHVADYKSNHLGPRFADYHLEAMVHSMAEHHYFLQYHIYVVALCRHLRNHLPDFDYQRDIGGVHYLYLRGMDPKGRGGVFFDHPQEDLIRALDQLFQGPEES